MKRNMYEEIENLKTVFYNIQCRNWILSRGKGTGAAGKTFEFLLNKEDDRYCLPDYNGIEIKTKYHNSAYPINLFSMAFDNKPMENTRLLNMCGYPSKKNPKYKCLNINVVGNNIKQVGYTFAYRLKVDYEAEVIRLQIFYLGELLEEEMSWSFKDLNSRLSHKLTYLAIIHVRKYCLEGKEYFKYDDITIYKIKDFDVFLKLIEEGIISATFKLSYFDDDERKGLIHDRGTNFGILEQDILKLYDLIDRG